MLLGVRLPEPLRLIGHSDADVGLHALTDALLGTLGAGDIGSHFPPSEARWAGADSTLFLAHARQLVAAAGGRIEHVDVTLICERPRIGPHRAAMVARLGELLDLGPGPRQRQGDHDRAAGLHRARRGHRRAGGRDRQPAGMRALRASDGARPARAARRCGSRPGAAPASCRARPAAGPRSRRCRSPGCWSLAGGPWLLAAAALAVFVVGIWAAERYMAAVGIHDPTAVVIDEIAGQWLTLCLVPLDPLAYAAGFFLFRVFDVLKPWPVSWLDRRVGGGFGVMIDDVAAALYAGGVLWLIDTWLLP